jgi:ribosomal protein S18 acetylase RimI-like enzyme
MNTMTSIEIRPIIAAEIPLLQELSRNTFSETFSSVNSAENMQQYLEQNLSIEKLTEEWQNEHTRFYFALRDNQLLGYLKLNTGNAQTELRDSLALEIERIYVLQAYHGQQVGQVLFEKAMEVAAQEQAQYIWLGVWEENKRALRFYEKNGFTVFDKHIFRLGNDEQTDLMMKKILTTK